MEPDWVLLGNPDFASQKRSLHIKKIHLIVNFSFSDYSMSNFINERSCSVKIEHFCNLRNNLHVSQGHDVICVSGLNLYFFYFLIVLFFWSRKVKLVEGYDIKDFLEFVSDDLRCRDHENVDGFELLVGLYEVRHVEDGVAFCYAENDPLESDFNNCS